MANAARRIIDKHREFEGEEESARVLAWLNRRSKDAGKDRVRKLVSLYLGENALGSIREIQKLCRRYVYYPLFIPCMPTHLQVSPHWCPASKNKKYAHGWAVEYDEMNAVFDLVQLAFAGLLERIGVCRCGKFFYRRFSHQKFCAARCRLAEFRDSDESRKKRNEYARKLYHLHKKLDSGKAK